jgi:hypothetical protein
MQEEGLVLMLMLLLLLLPGQVQGQLLLLVRQKPVVFS